MKQTEMLQQGVDSKFDTTLASLMRMHQELEEANYYSGFNTIQSLQLWLSALTALDRELSPYISLAEEKLLLPVRVRLLPEDLPNKKFINDYFRKNLDSYERTLRLLHATHGFGMKADIDSMTSVALRSFQ